tara:strand:- start:108 stop:284 length:177 start_codon:yes stop_codon:yes gene_type:complete
MIVVYNGFEWSQPCGHGVIYNIKSPNLHRKTILKKDPTLENAFGLSKAHFFLSTFYQL